MKWLPVLLSASSIAAMTAGAAADWLNPPLAGASRAPIPPAAAPPASARPPQRSEPASAGMQQQAATPSPAPSRSHPPQPGELASVEPQRPAGLRDKAARFIDFYWDIVGDSAPAVLDYLRSTYAPVVDYYGKPTAKAAILGDKQRYLRRWPTRSSWPVSAAAAPEIACNESAAECEIKGERDFANGDPARGAHAAGRVAYDYRVRFRGGAAQIVAENSTVLARRW